jgi:carboxymethylenebutenolidase
MAEQTITINSGEISLPAFVASPDQSPKGGIIVIHEIWGLNEHTKDVAKRFAEQGYMALAPDLLSGTELDGGFDPQLMQQVQNSANRAQGQKLLQTKMAALQAPEFIQNTVNKVKDCFDWLMNKPETHGKIAVVGFCFGGSYCFALAVAEPRLKAAIPFYGHAEQTEDQLRNINCPILAFYGEQDTALTEKLPELTTKMKNAGKNFQYKVYPNTGHAFFNDTNPNRYDEPAARDAWTKTLAFLSENLN